MSTTPDAAPQPPDDPRPTTGNAVVDAALAAVHLGADVRTHPDQLAQALEGLQRALNPPAPPPGMPGPRP